MAKDLTKKRIKSGVGCIPCSIDHFLTSSEAICEASRMSGTRKLTDKEITDRLCDATRQFNVCERFDLSDTKIQGFPNKEKKMAKWLRKQSGILRHDLKNISNKEDLSKLCAKSDRSSKLAFNKMMRLNIPMACPVDKKKR
jgi:hypothetical protein